MEKGASNNEKIVVGALKQCEKRYEVEDVFSRFGVEDCGKRTDLLTCAMGEAEMFYSSGKPSDEQKYELTLQMFLAMTWKYDD